VNKAKISPSQVWDEIHHELTDLFPTNDFNIVNWAVDRHAGGSDGDRPALCWFDGDGGVRTISYTELKAQTHRFANTLGHLGIKRGERVFTLAGCIPELYIAALGTLRYGAVFCPLFTDFGPQPIYQRLTKGDARVLVTTRSLYTRKIAGIRRRLPRLTHILLTDLPKTAPGPGARDPGVTSLEALLRRASPCCSTAVAAPEDWAVIHFTSGTSGSPKGAVHVHDGLRVLYLTAKHVLKLGHQDVFWCTADPGWITGVAYGMIAPLVIGATVVVQGEGFDAIHWCRILSEQQVTVWYTSPTAIRRLMRLDPGHFKAYDFSRLRFTFSVGEPLAADAVLWGQKVLGCPIRDTWWQTETGGIMIAQIPGEELRPGAMGCPVPGIEAALVRKTDAGNIEFIRKPQATGELALKSGWPSMFRDYLHDSARYRKSFAQGWYLTGDLARRDQEGYFWFVGRADEVILTAGHLVGPFEVERVLTAHPAVSEAGVVGRPDAVAGEVVKAYVSLKKKVQDHQLMTRELLGFARRQLGPALAPREIEIVDKFPKNQAGKILRRELKTHGMKPAM